MGQRSYKGSVLRFDLSRRQITADRTGCRNSLRSYIAGPDLDHSIFYRNVFLPGRGG